MGVLTNLQADQILANPGRFNPRDPTQWTWITDDVAPDEDTISAESGTSFRAGWLLDPDVLLDAIAWFVGYAWVGPSTHRVNRWTPAIHPEYPYMRCTGVSVKGTEYRAETKILANVPNLKKLKHPVYGRCRFDLTWEQLEYDCKEDGEVATEWDRFLTVDPTDLGEIITVDGGQYNFQAPSDPSMHGKPAVVNGPTIKVYAQRAGLVVKSFGLPAHFLMDEYNIATKFLAAKGKVNSTTFLGKPAGTMLLLDYKFRKKAMPIETHRAGELLFGLQTEMTFGYTDPDRAEPTESRRGWQLIPGVNGIGALGWYAVLNANNEPLYPEYNMNALLTLHSSP